MGLFLEWQFLSPHNISRPRRLWVIFPVCFILGLGALVFHVNSANTYAPQKLYWLPDAFTEMWPPSSRPCCIFSIWNCRIWNMVLAATLRHVTRDMGWWLGLLRNIKIDASPLAPIARLCCHVTRGDRHRFLSNQTLSLWVREWVLLLPP